MRLQESEELYRVAVENSRDGVALIRGDKHLYVNTQLLHMLECATPDELVGKSILRSVHPDDREMVARFVRAGVGGGPAPDRYEFRIVTKTGVTRHVEVSANRVTYDGEPVGLAFLRDVTERKKGEEALRESEEKFRLLFEKSMDPILLLDGDTFADCNEASLRLMGCSRSQLLGLHPWDISPERQPDGRLSWQKAHETIESALREGVSRFEWLHHTFNGQDLWADVSLTVVPIGGRQIMYTVWRDIEKRKRAEEALLTSQFYLWEAMDLAKIVHWELDPATETFIFNDAFYAFYGTTAEKEGGYRMAAEEYSKRFVHPDDRAMVHQSAQDMESGRDPESLVDLEHRITRRDGGVRHILTRTRRFRDVSGRIVRCHGANQDITERRQAEEEKAALESQLRQAQKMEAIGTLTGGIAHDFNNILSAMIGFAEMAKSRALKGSRQEHHLERVLNAGLRGKELVKQLLAFGRNTEQKKEPLELSGAVREVMKLLRASIPSTISIRVIVGSESGLVLADPTQMQQVLMNLCTNAAYAMQEKGGVLDVDLSDFVASATEKVDGVEPGLYMRLVVRDTGVGIAPEIIDRIFDPFFTTKKQGEGTGLGLSVVHGIVQQHGGRITVESKPGSGATFTVYLPQVVRRRKARIASVESVVPTGHERVLFVDDEEVLVEMGRELLEGLGYKVTVTSDSIEALALCKADPGRFDLLVTDQTMPELSGIELAREVMALRPDMPIIIITGFSHLVDAAVANAAGIRAFLMKPLTRDDLAQTVRKVLDG